MELKARHATYSLVHTLLKKPIMRRGDDGFFYEIGRKHGVLIKREQGGDVWYHDPEDYLEWVSYIRD